MHIYAFCMHNHKLQHAFLLLLLLEVFLAIIFDDQARKLFVHFCLGGGLGLNQNSLSVGLSTEDIFRPPFSEVDAPLDVPPIP